MSGLGAWTIVLATLAVGGVLLCGHYPKPLLVRVLPYFGFLAWMGLGLTWTHPSFGGVQNGILYLLFGSFVIIAGVVSGRQPAAARELIRRWIRWIDWISFGVVLLGMIVFGLPTSGTWSWVGPRGLALLGLMPLSWHLAEWHYGVRGAKGLAFLWLVAIALTLSRTAMAISLALVGVTGFLQLRFRLRKAGWSIVFFLLSLTAAGALVRYGPFRDRFFSGDTSIEVGGTRINASGRLDLWQLVIRSARESPVVGKGLGSSLDVLQTEFVGEQPHNDYLRLWHDFGIIGLLCYVVATWGWLVILLQNWYHSELESQSGQLELAGALGLLGVLLAMVTDNVIVYVFVMGPLAVLVGAGLGVHRGPERASTRE